MIKIERERESQSEINNLQRLSLMLVEIFAKHPAVTAPEETGLLTVTGTQSGALARYAEGESPLKHFTKHASHSSLSNLESASMHATCSCN